MDFNILEIIEKDITDKYGSKGDIIITGDLNARTGSHPDFIQDDDFSHIPIDNNSYEVDVLVGRRTNNDNILDSRGRDILDLCISNKLRILNGRSFGDSSGKFTCFNYAGCSVVDYYIVSESLLSNILYMSVSDFIPTLSDCHCQLSLKLLSSFEREKINFHMRDFPKYFKWNDESSLRFQNAFSHPLIQQNIKTFMDSKIENNAESIQRATENLHSIVTKAANISLRRRPDRKKRVDTKKWFDSDLYKIRKVVFSKAKLMAKYPRDPIIRGSFYKANKAYSKLRKFKKKEFKQNILDKLDDLQSSQPKEYWNLVKSLKDSKKDNPEKCIDDKTWHEYFSKLSSIPDKYQARIHEISRKISLLESDPCNKTFSNLDFKISEGELNKAFTKLKSGKSPGLDSISNEMLKSVQVHINPCLLRLFNTVFLSGIYPEKWSEGYLIPIFKSENPLYPQNYRGITITNNIGKLFNTILNNRLDKFLFENDIIHESQIGFCKKSRTSDHLFVLRCLIEKYTSFGNKRLYVCFVDFQKAFDTVIHAGIKLKLLQNNISNLFYKILSSMYSCSKTHVKVGNKLTESFTSHIGVRQGDVLSPNIFKIFLNDFSIYLEENSVPVSLNRKNIYSLLYADDLVLIAERASDLQNKLCLLERYCKKWCLQVNTTKTKVIIFNKAGKIINEKFSINDCNIECVKHYKYLGIWMTSSGSFKEARTQLYNKAMKANFKLYKDLNSSDPSVKTSLHLFDHMIKPILLYGSEIWGTPSRAILHKNKELYDIYKDWEFEKLNIKFCKYLMGVSKKSTNIAVISELGRFPLFIDLIVSLLLFWHRAENASESSLLSNALKESTILHDKGISSWFSTIHGFSTKLNIDLNYCKTLKVSNFKFQIKKVLKSCFLSYWYTIRDSYKNVGKLSTYFEIKRNFNTESYLSLKQSQNRHVIARFRISAHRLRIETGRYERKKNKDGNLIPLERGERLCVYCNNNKVEDEFHFLIECPLYKTERDNFITLINKYTKNFENLSMKNKFFWILNNENIETTIRFGQFLSEGFLKRQNTNVHNN